MPVTLVECVRVVVKTNAILHLTDHGLPQLQQQGVDFVGLLQAETEDKSKGKAVEAEKATDDNEALADDDELGGTTMAAVETRVESGTLVDDSKGEAALKEKGRLIDEEERNTGEVKSSVYLEYMRSIGGLGLLSLLVLSSLLKQARTSSLLGPQNFGTQAPPIRVD
jgi:hypothetical protein